MMVFLLHYGGGKRSSNLLVHSIAELIAVGWLGVSLFFVLSGFLISGILWESFDRPGWWRRFYIRRSLRIFPLYYTVLILAVVVYAFQHSLQDAWPALWVYGLYLQNIPPLAAHADQFNLMTQVGIGHFWTLAVEEQFYLIWPLLLGAFSRNRRGAMRMILILWTLSLGFRYAVLISHQPGWAIESLFARCGELLAGAYLALLLRGSSIDVQRIFKYLPAVLFSSLTGMVLCLVIGHGIEPSTIVYSLGFSFSSIFFACLIASSLRPGLAQSFFSISVLRWLGKISYGIYVYHLLLRTQFTWIASKLAPQLGYNAHLALVAVVGLVGTLLVATLSFYTLENFFLKLKDRFSKQPPSLKTA